MIFKNKAFCFGLVNFLYLLISVLGDDPNLVLIISRHGARAPNENKFDPTWGDQYGQLTKTGMRQHYLLGAALAEKYKDHALKSYSPSTIFLRAHSQNRTLQSMYAQALGLFPPGTGPVLSNGTIALENRLQPFSVHSMNLTQDYLLFTHSSTVCPLQSSIVRNQTEKEPQKVLQLINSTVNKLSETYGRNITLNDIGKIFDTLRCNYFENKSFPSNLSFIEYNDVYWKDLAFAHDWWFMYKEFSTLQQRSLLATNLLHEITARFNNFFTQKSASSLTFLSYVGHDTTLAPILGLFNITTHECILATYQNGQSTNPACYAPVFASSLRFELYKKTNSSDSYLKMFYDDHEINMCQNKTGLCTVAAFNQTVETLTNGTNLTDFYQQCYSMMASTIEEGSGFKTTMWILLGLNGLFIIVLILALLYRKKLKTSSNFDNTYNSSSATIH